MGDSFYIFGGMADPFLWTGTKTVASFSTITKEWKNLGNLKEARYDHAVFVHMGDFVVVGGQSELTERCKLNNDTIQCKAIEPKLQVYYPVLMSIPHDYCKK